MIGGVYAGLQSARAWSAKHISLHGANLQSILYAGLLPAKQVCIVCIYAGLHGNACPAALQIICKSSEHAGLQSLWGMTTDHTNLLNNHVCSVCRSIEHSGLQSQSMRVYRACRSVEHECIQNIQVCRIHVYRACMSMEHACLHITCRSVECMYTENAGLWSMQV